MNGTNRVAALEPYPEHPSERRLKANGHAEKPTQKPKASLSETANRFTALNAFIDYMMVDLTRAELATWLVLYRDTRNGVAQASIDAIAKRTGTSRQHTQKAITSLQQRGLIEQIKKGAINSGASIYRVKLLSAKDAITVHP
jgi:hypothetical protein